VCHRYTQLEGRPGEAVSLVVATKQRRIKVLPISEKRTGTLGTQLAVFAKNAFRLNIHIYKCGTLRQVVILGL